MAASLQDQSGETIGGDHAADGATIEQLRQILGRDNVLLDDASREFYSQDLSFRPHEVAAMVLQPASVEALADAVGVATRAGYAVVPRGGGMSYTSGYTPERARSVLIDMRKMNRVIEINADDMYVIVETGCTWKDLHEALAPHGVRSPIGARSRAPMPRSAARSRRTASFTAPEPVAPQRRRSSGSRSCWPMAAC